MTPYVELLLVALTLLIIGRYYIPPLVLVLALRDTEPRERAEIVKQLNIYYRRRGVGPLDPPPSGETPPRRITGPPSGPDLFDRR